MMERWMRVVMISVIVLTLIFYYHSQLVLIFGCSSNEAIELQERLELVSSQIEKLKRRHDRLVAAVKRSPWLHNGSPPHHLLSLVAISYEYGPSEEYETLRRRVSFNTKELWYYVSHQLGKATQETFEGQKRIMVSTLKGVAERKRWLLSMQEQLPLEDGREDWRRKEAVSVSDLVQRRLHFLQHPPDCMEAKKLLCPYEWDCGFGCDIHYLASCLILAYATERTLVLINVKTWRYYGTANDQGWVHVFRPLSETCTEYYNETYVTPVPAGNPKDKVLYIPALFYRRNFKYGVPMHYIPRDLAQRIVRFSGDPASWWVGQMLKYILKPQYHTKKAILDAVAEMNFISPIVGVHIRRTDKLIREADFHSLDEYMSKVEDYYAKLEQTAVVDVRRVFLASDDASVLKEAMMKYPQYKFYSNHSRAQQAGLKTRYTMEALTGLLVDVYMLTICDYVVGTLSSNIARTIYELMHTHHIDASNRFISLDFTNYYYRGEPLFRIAVMRNADISFNIGDVIASYRWNCTSDGTVLRTKITGRIPWYKTEEQLVLYSFPKYEQVPIYTDNEATSGVKPSY